MSHFSKAVTLTRDTLSTGCREYHIPNTMKEEDVSGFYWYCRTGKVPDSVNTKIPDSNNANLHKQDSRSHKHLNVNY